MTIKAITLWQPWASLVVLGAKCIETRTWATKHRGLLAIHAAKRDVPVDDWPSGAGMILSNELMDFAHSPSDLRVRQELPKGCVVGTVELVSVRQVSGFTDTGPVLSWPDQDKIGGLPLHDLGVYLNARHSWRQEHRFGDYTPGRYAWLLRDPVLFEEPVPAIGRQGMWEWSP